MFVDKNDDSMQYKEQHRGEIVANVVRKSGISLSILASKMGISRNTLYSKFKEKSLSYEFILKLGAIIYYNFAIEFPEIILDTAPPRDARAQLWRLEKKYKHLLEQYNQLLKFLLKKSQDAEQHALHRKIKALIVSSSF